MVSTAANIGGLGLGPLVAGGLAQFVTGPLRTPYLVFVVLIGLSIVAVIATPETVHRAGRARTDGQRLGRAWTWRPQRVARVYGRLGKFKWLPLPIPIPPADVAVHWHERFDGDAGNRWLRQQLVELFGN